MTFPSWLINHPDLKDFDIRMLLTLDQMGWREGERDGIVRASNEDLAARLHKKSTASIKASLARIERVRPVLIAREMFNGHWRDAIRLVYDRYGSADVTFRDAANLTVTQGEAPPAKILATPVPIGTTPTPIAPVLTAGTPPANFLAGAPPAKILATHPYRKREIPVDPELAREVANFLATPDVAAPTVSLAATAPDETPPPRTVEELVAWLPAVCEDPEAIRKLARKVPLWVGRLVGRHSKERALAIEWVQDALIRSVDSDNVVRYSEAVLARYVEQGGRPGVELPSVPFRPVPDPETDIAVPVVYGPVPPAPRPAPAQKLSFAQRKAADRAAYLAKFDAVKERKAREAEHGNGA